MKHQIRLITDIDKGKSKRWHPKDDKSTSNRLSIVSIAFVVIQVILLTVIASVDIFGISALLYLIPTALLGTSLLLVNIKYKYGKLAKRFYFITSVILWLYTTVPIVLLAMTFAQAT